MRKTILAFFVFLLVFSAGCAKKDVNSTPATSSSYQEPQQSSASTQTKPDSSSEPIEESKPDQAATTPATVVKASPMKPAVASVTDLIAHGLSYVIENFGNTKKEDDGFIIDALPDVKVFLENGVITKTIVRNDKVDVFGTRIGQLPSEVIQILGKPDNAGVDEENGGFMRQVTINSDTSAAFFSEDEKSPITGILVSYTPKTLPVEVSTPSNAPVVLVAQVISIEDRFVSVQVTNAGTTPVENAVIEVQVSGTSELGSNFFETVTASFKHLEVGEMKQGRFMSVMTGLSDAVIKKTKGQAVEPKKE